MVHQTNQVVRTTLKRPSENTVDEFAHDLEKLFERSYGRRKGMDESSKEMLKKDFLCKVCG